jgi:hypothetical protein
MVFVTAFLVGCCVSAGLLSVHTPVLVQDNFLLFSHLEAFRSEEAPSGRFAELSKTCSNST